MVLSPPGTNPACRPEDASEDTIGVLVRLITEKKGEEGGLAPSPRQSAALPLPPARLGQPGPLTVWLAVLPPFLLGERGRKRHTAGPGEE